MTNERQPYLDFFIDLYEEPPRNEHNSRTIDPPFSLPQDFGAGRRLGRESSRGLAEGPPEGSTVRDPATGNASSMRRDGDRVAKTPSQYATPREDAAHWDQRYPRNRDGVDEAGDEEWGVGDGGADGDASFMSSATVEAEEKSQEKSTRPVSRATTPAERWLSGWQRRLRCWWLMLPSLTQVKLNCSSQHAM